LILVPALLQHGFFSLLDPRTLQVTTFEWIIGLSLAAVVLSALARRSGVPYPTFLAAGGALLAFVPASPPRATPCWACGNPR